MKSLVFWNDLYGGLTNRVRASTTQWLLLGVFGG
jgi:hypothetical protein